MAIQGGGFTPQVTQRLTSNLRRMQTGVVDLDRAISALSAAGRGGGTSGDSSDKSRDVAGALKTMSALMKTVHDSLETIVSNLKS